eukprot:CAMPEP_0172198750 /NCGR_PEP_ID=MMETSP1050-20130122/28277_1 /TAXON_ID=233186 /ORGANISM="Cryptomonas curvata, Strain CCAP979/52" /LENGTH=77 /DNA_ID=CAMNT_0012875639 /DNA_START=152 /DNA_END=381 /DNA_ORIENTATION=+
MSFTPPGAGETMSLTWAVLDGQPESSDWIGLFRSGSDEKLLQHRICCKNEQKGGTWLLPVPRDAGTFEFRFIRSNGR